MATDTTAAVGVAGRYASALFDLAKETQAVDKVEADLKSFQGLLGQSDDLVRLVRSPVISAAEQAQAISTILDKVGIGGLAANFIKVLAGNRRLFAVSDMITAFSAMASTARGEVTAEVASAAALTDAQIAELKAALKASIGKDVMLDTKVDPSLLGGLVVKVGSRMIDSSLKTKLQSLKVSLSGADA